MFFINILLMLSTFFDDIFPLRHDWGPAQYNRVLLLEAFPLPGDTPLELLVREVMPRISIVGFPTPGLGLFTKVQISGELRAGDESLKLENSGVSLDRASFKLLLYWVIDNAIQAPAKKKLYKIYSKKFQIPGDWHELYAAKKA